MTRIALRPAGAMHFAGLLAGDRPEPGIALPGSEIAPREVLTMLADLAAGIALQFTPAAWLVLDGVGLVGLLSLTLPPRDGVLTIGYGIAPSEQGRGAAGGAVAALIGWALQDERVLALAAETHVANLASQRVLAQNGFSQVGQRHDEEDGDLLCWRLDVSGV